MGSRVLWHNKLTSWAGWLPAAVLLAALAVGVLSLSPDGARLRRLAGTPADGGRERETAVLTGGQQGAAVAAELSAENLGHGDEMAAVARRESTPPWKPASDEAGQWADGPAGETGSGIRGDQYLGPMGKEGGSASPGAVDPAVGNPAGAGESVVASKEALLTGSIRAEVMGQIDQVQVLLDGENKGATPVLLHGVGPGVHRLTFMLGDQLWEEEVRVSAGDTTLAACSFQDPSAPGQVLIEPYRDARGVIAGTDSVFVNGELEGEGETTLELLPGNYLISFARGGANKRHVVIHVTPGSVQYVLPPDVEPAVAMQHTPPERDGASFVFTLRLQPVLRLPPDVSICFPPPGAGPLKTARMTSRSSNGVYVATLPARSLSSTFETRYFFRVTLTSGEEIDSRIYTFDGA